MSLEDKIKARAASAGIDPAKVSVAVVGAPATEREDECDNEIEEDN